MIGTPASCRRMAQGSVLRVGMVVAAGARGDAAGAGVAVGVGLGAAQPARAVTHSAMNSGSIWRMALFRRGRGHLHVGLSGGGLRRGAAAL